jgi:Uncharacterized conserved protein, contains double-stranded beta-helix domain
LWRDEATGASIAMIRFAKGAGIPQPHYHASNQFMICLSGKYEYTSTGVTLTAGSFYCNPKGNVHGPAIAHEDTVVIEVYDGPHYPRSRPGTPTSATRTDPFYFLPGTRSRRRAGVIPDQVTRDRAFAALSPTASPRRRGPRRRPSGQHEQAAAERRRETEFGENHAGSAIDVHWHGSPLLRCKLRLHCAADGGKASAHRAGGSGGLHQGEQSRRTRIARVKTMSEAGNVAGTCVEES